MTDEQLKEPAEKYADGKCNKLTMPITWLEHYNSHIAGAKSILDGQEWVKKIEREIRIHKNTLERFEALQKWMAM